MLKTIEKTIRRWLLRLAVRCFSVASITQEQLAVCLEHAPILRIVVIRLDARLGNILLLTPLLASLRLRYQHARIDVVLCNKYQHVLSNHPSIDHIYGFSKWALFKHAGPFGMCLFLRQQQYTLCIDAANPTCPSFTHMLLARLSGARATVGSAYQFLSHMYTCPVMRNQASVHEIDLRLQLLSVLPKFAVIKQTSFGLIPQPRRDDLLQCAGGVFGLLNIGARLPEKIVSQHDYSLLAQLLQAHGLQPVLSFGPLEAALAQACLQTAPNAILAPSTNVYELAFLIQHARVVISCDTGPMHLSVAVGTPTCGIFVSTDPHRFGYQYAPHTWVDIRQQSLAAVIPQIQDWLVTHV